MSSGSLSEGINGSFPTNFFNSTTYLKIIRNASGRIYLKLHDSSFVNYYTSQTTGVIPIFNPNNQNEGFVSIFDENLNVTFYGCMVRAGDDSITPQEFEKFMSLVNLPNVNPNNLEINTPLIINNSGSIISSTVTNTELSYLGGLSSTIQTQLNNKQPNITVATNTELSYLGGLSSTIQTQLNNKQPTITGAATTITSSNLTLNRALLSDGTGKVAISAATSTELSYLGGLSSTIQTQLNTNIKVINSSSSTLEPGFIDLIPTNFNLNIGYTTVFNSTSPKILISYFNSVALKLSNLSLDYNSSIVSIVKFRIPTPTPYINFGIAGTSLELRGSDYNLILSADNNIVVSYFNASGYFNNVTTSATPFPNASLFTVNLDRYLEILIVNHQTVIFSFYDETFTLLWTTTLTAGNINWGTSNYLFMIHTEMGSMNIYDIYTSNTIKSVKTLFAKVDPEIFKSINIGNVKLGFHLLVNE
jgi:hypothetical protein